ncbi:MAG TPA: hypothetical protein VFE51_08615 [Verrucomicrobiae bacterium]|nr:hypothetical protein [Verrucomicrobiae bacterium]
MTPKQYKLLALTFAVQALFYAVMVIWRFPTWTIWPMLLPLLGYAVTLYGAPIFAKRSAILKMGVITVCAFLLTMAAHIMLGVLFLLYSLALRGGVRFWGPE